MSIPLDEAAYFFTDQKVSFLVTKEGRKYLVNKTLKELEEELDPRKFYRANRKYIIHISSIKSYRASEKVKIQVELTLPVPEEHYYQPGKRHRFQEMDQQPVVCHAIWYRKVLKNNQTIINHL